MGEELFDDRTAETFGAAGDERELTVKCPVGRERSRRS